MTTGPWRVVWRDTVTSTMDAAGVLAEAGASHGTIIVADLQLKGRGRSGRPWVSARGSSLTLTGILRPSLPIDSIAPLSLLFGAAVADAISDLSGLTCSLKWPNDVWLEERKVAGVLLTSRLTPWENDDAERSRTLLVGIGINVTTPPEELPRDATSVLVALARRSAPRAIDRDTLLSVLVPLLRETYDQFVTSPDQLSLDTWRERAVMLGEVVQIEDAGRIHTGVFADVDDGGALLLQDERGVQRFVVGDVTRGPRRLSD